jgi:hypothetical protein
LRNGGSEVRLSVKNERLKLRVCLRVVKRVVSDMSLRKDNGNKLNVNLHNLVHSANEGLTFR